MILGWVRALTGAGAWWLVAAAGIIGAAGGVAGSRVFYGASIARLEAKAATERAGVVSDRYDALLELHRRSEAGFADLAGRSERAAEALALGSARILESDQVLRRAAAEVMKDERYACRALPLPVAYLGQLRRAGETSSAPAGGGTKIDTDTGVLLQSGAGPAP